MRATFYNLGCFYEDALSRPKLARRCYQYAITLLEASRAGLERGIHRLTYLQDKLPVYRQLALLEWQLGTSLVAWEMVERMRSRHLIDILATVPLAPPSSVPSHLQQQERQLLAQLRQMLNARLNGETGETLTLSNKIGRLETKLLALWQGMEAIAPDYVSLRRGRPLLWRTMQQLLTY